MEMFLLNKDLCMNLNMGEYFSRRRKELESLIKVVNVWSSYIKVCKR